MNTSSSAIEQAIQQVETVVKGKDKAIRLSLACFLAGGHLLLDDLPGMGKTTLATALAKVLGLSYKRVQFTSDLLPADILGSTLFDQENSRFRFQKGPIFTQLLLADEINRSTPKTQSALLEAMSEKTVSVDGQSLPLPEPFFVIATQNPISQLGTFPLPESQLDRFLISLQLGYPDAKSERELLKGIVGKHQLANLSALFDPDKIQQLQQMVDAIAVSDAILDYVQTLIQKTRDHADLAYGISPRGALALLKMAKAWALLQQREYLIADDVQAVILPVFLHRLAPAARSSQEAEAIIAEILQQVAVD